MTLLITGATGSVGRALITSLVNADQQVRALTRNAEAAELPPSVHVVEGDLDDPSTLTAGLFDGVEAVFVFPAGRVDELVSRAVTAGVDRFVVMSSLAVSAEFPRDIGSASYRHHLAVEQAVTTRAAGWTLLRPGTFADNLLSWAAPIIAGRPVRVPYPRSAQAPIHEADVAAVAALALTEPGHTGRTYAMTGPESLTKLDQLEAIGRAVGRSLELEEITPDQFRAEVGRFVPDDVITMLLDYWSDTLTTPETPRTTVQDLTGAPGRTLASWALDHRAAFGFAP